MSEQMEKNILKILEKVENLEKNQEKLEKNQEEFRGNLSNIINRVDKIEEKLDYVSTDLINFSRHFAVFEHEFSLKVDTLFENYDKDFKEHKKFKEDIDLLKDDSFKYNVQIEHLSKKLANA